MNEYIKSADLIGIRPLLIEPHHVGQTIGQFMARETKRADWEFNRNSPHDLAQLRFLELVRIMGGDAAFAKGVGTI